MMIVAIMIGVMYANELNPDIGFRSRSSVDTVDYPEMPSGHPKLKESTMKTQRQHNIKSGARDWNSNWNLEERRSKSRKKAH